MTKPNTATGLHLLIIPEDPANPGTYLTEAACGIRTTTFGRTAKSVDFEVPDCDSPDLPAYVERALTSKSATVAGDGYMNADKVPLWDTLFDGGVSFNCRVRFDKPVAIAGRTYQGLFVCTKLEYKAQFGQKIGIALELQSDGALAQSVT